MKTKIKTGMEIHPELQKQRQKIQELEKQIEEGEFGVVLVAGFLRGIRNSGYRNNAKALEELIDNSIQAGADNIQVRFGFDGKDPEKTDNPSFIAVMDDGHGMDKPWVRNCLSFGGTHRENDRSGFGRFGYGLKASCLSFGKSIKVFSKTADGNLWHSCEFDIEKVIEAKTGNNQTSRIPQAIQEDPPKDLLKWFNEHNNGAGSGTIIVIGKIDRERLSFKKHHALRDYLKKEFGIVYRNALQQRKILIEGNIKDGKQTADEVAPTDPLFIMPNSRFVNESGFAPAEAIPPHEFKILAENYAGEKNVYGTIRVRYSYMGPLFWDEHDKRVPGWRFAREITA